MDGEKNTVTQVQSDLIMLLKSCGLDMDTTVGVVGLCRTDENRQRMITAIIDIYDEKGEVTEQEIHMIGLTLTGDAKPEFKAKQQALISQWSRHLKT